jgi:hypothetical protein
MTVLLSKQLAVKHMEQLSAHEDDHHHIPHIDAKQK